MKITKNNKLIKTLALLALLPLPAQAVDGEFNFHQSNSATATSTTKYDSTKLFNFSPELLNAAQNCAAYSEDFTAANPELKQLGNMFGGIDFSIPVSITGKKDGLCGFTIEYKIADSGSRYDCRISAEQQDALVQAMKDRSTAKHTETFVSYLGSTTNADGEETPFPTKTTVSGNLFDVTFAKTLAESCKLTEIETTEEEAAATEKEALTFSGEFQKALTACSPATETRQFLFFSKQLDILGSDENSCRLKFDNFTLNVPLSQTAELKNFNDITALLNDKNIAVYTPEYNTDDLLFVLDKCLKNESSTFSSGSAGTETSSLGSVNTVRGLKYTADGNNCRLEFLNTLDRNGEKEDYSLNCNAAKEDLTAILAPYDELLKLYGEKSSYENGIYRVEGPTTNEQTRTAGEELFKTLQNRKLCTAPAAAERKKPLTDKSALIKWKE